VLAICVPAATTLFVHVRVSPFTTTVCAFVPLGVFVNVTVAVIREAAWTGNVPPPQSSAASA
jgi:hypothetical protein